MATVLPLIQARKRPHFALPWLGILLGLAAVAFGIQGQHSMAATPHHRLEVVVEGEHPRNISQATVEAALGEPILSWKPLRVLVTPNAMGASEVKELKNSGVDAVISTVIPQKRSQDSNDKIQRAYVENAVLGHGPAAVAAAAHRAAETLDSKPIQSRLFWVSGTIILVSLALLAVAYSLSRRRRHEAVYRRLRTAQRQLATVVLELEALEVSYLSTAEERRTPGFEASWRMVRDGSLTLARSEDAAMAAVQRSASALKASTTALVEDFELSAQELITQADALMDASTVLGALSGHQGVLDRLATPVTFAARELLTLLESRPEGTVAQKRVDRLQDALDSSLDVLAADRGAGTSLAAWRTAEVELQNSVLAILRSLRVKSGARASRKQNEDAELSELRTSLGLDPDGSKKILDSLHEATVAVAAVLGAPSGSIPSPHEGDATSTSWWLRLLPRRNKDFSWVVPWVALALTGVIAVVVLLPNTPHGSDDRLTGTLPLRSLRIDGAVDESMESAMRDNATRFFTEDLDVTVAVRQAAEYLGTWADDSPRDIGQLSTRDSEMMLNAMWRLKGEFPELADPRTGELRPDQALLPIWKGANGRYSSPAFMVGALSRAESNPFQVVIPDRLLISTSVGAEDQLSEDLRKISRGLQNNVVAPSNTSVLWAFPLLALSIGLALYALLMVIHYGGSISLQLGRFGRNADTVRRLRRQLEGLALGLDNSRLNSATLGVYGFASSSAESDQRIFERALAAAWRMEDELAAQPLSQRLSTDYVAAIDSLEELVTALALRDDDVAGRTAKLLELTLRRHG